MRSSEIVVGGRYIVRVYRKSEGAVRVDAVRSLGRLVGSARNYPERFRYDCTALSDGAKLAPMAARSFVRRLPEPGYEIREATEEVEVVASHGPEIFPFSFFRAFESEDWILRERSRAERGDPAALGYLIARDELIERGLLVVGS